jgi:breast cancer 2 susceptibility protein
MPIESHPELELTDGWYRLKAQVDLPMARAVRKGVIRVGRKIGVAGARVCLFSLVSSTYFEALPSYQRKERNHRKYWKPTTLPS